MGTAAGPELTAAVSNAGACGVLGTARVPACLLRQQIQRVRALTNKPFGINRILAHPQEGQIEICFDEAVPLLVFFWGDPAPYVKDAHRCAVGSWGGWCLSMADHVTGTGAPGRGERRWRAFMLTALQIAAFNCRIVWQTKIAMGTP